MPNNAQPALASEVFDVAIVGAGMAGASLAFELAPHLRVLLLEQETQVGYHTTSRSAALFSEIYGNAAIRALSRASRQFLQSPSAGFCEQPLLAPRGSLFFASEQQFDSLHALHDEVGPRAPRLQWLAQKALLARLPALRADSVAAGVFEPDACDIDVHALHQGYLRGARRHGALVRCGAMLTAAEQTAGHWVLQTRAGNCSAGLLVNAAGPWADEVAGIVGAGALGLTPLRRTAMVFEDKAAWASEHWPLAVDIDEQFYFKPDAGRLLASPADETPSPPCDAQADEYDIAVLIDRLETATLLSPRRICGRWAGLRTFAPDRAPVVGFDSARPCLFWLAGQGGYGIQTAPALAQLAASQILRRSIPQAIADQGLDAQTLSPSRFAAA
jgi:D-arginine dehydrogenase